MTALARILYYGLFRSVSKKTYLASYTFEFLPLHFSPTKQNCLVQLAYLSTDLTKLRKIQNTPTTQQETYPRKNRKYTKEEDARILVLVDKLGSDNPETWKTLAIEFDVIQPHNIKARWKLITSREIKDRKRFTKEDDKMILDYVKKNGETKESWIELAKIVYKNMECGGVSYMYGPLHVRDRHIYITTHADKKFGKFSKQEDKMILNDVKKYGNTKDTFINLAGKLNRMYHYNIEKRHDHLINMPSKPPGGWTLEEDKLLLQSLFENDPSKINNLDTLESFQKDDFIAASKRIERSKQSCRHRFHGHILHILKTDLLNLPQGVKWMSDVLDYIVRNKVMSTKDISYNKVLKEVCPGQSSDTIRGFANDLRREWNGKKLIQSTQPLHEICLRRLNEPNKYSYLGNEKMAEKKLRYAEDIIEIKKLMINEDSR